MSVASRRSKRKATIKPKMPNAAYYLGYVNDDETPEMIMQKFAELEKLQAKNPNLTEDQQAELAKKTSPQVIKQVVSEDANMRATLGYDNFWVLDDEEESTNDDDDRYVGEDDEFQHHPSKKRKKSVPSKQKSSAIKHTVSIMGKFSAKKEVSLKDPLACTYVKIPDSPIPSSWAKQITPLENFTVQYKYSTPFPKNGNLETTVLLLQEKKLQSSSYYEVDSILDFNLRSFKKKFEVVLIDPPYDRVKPEQMSKLALGNRMLMPKGYLFVWVEKEYIADIIDLMKQWKFEYAENLTWVKKNVNNTFVMDDYAYFAKSKLSLFIFRKMNEETKKMDIRHQRNPDVVFDFIKQDRNEKPEFAFQVIETLIPQAKAEGKCLYLWGKKGFTAEGWTIVVEKQPIQYSNKEQVK